MKLLTRLASMVLVTVLLCACTVTGPTEPAPSQGWLQENGQVYYLDAQGNPFTGWQTLEGKRYYFDPSQAGAMTTGWLNLEDQTYYLDAQGVLQIGWITVAGQRYYMRRDGSMHTGWLADQQGKAYFSQDGTLYTGWLETEAGKLYLGQDGYLVTGWLETDEGTYYTNGSGIPVTGWQMIDQKRYYFDADGRMYTGWLEEKGLQYYLRQDGTAAQGRLEIEGQEHFFTSTGRKILLINPWHSIPEDYQVELVKIGSQKVSTECYDALMQMLEDCKAAGFKPILRSSYRTYELQSLYFNNWVKMLESGGMSHDKAVEETKKSVAYPGTSEHHLGVAVDLIDADYQVLDKHQANMPTQKWLMEHCWEYGFILRYPIGKTDITGIIYEPWHYRYVGVELAMELKELGICLEEYLDMLTGEGPSCGGLGR